MRLALSGEALAKLKVYGVMLQAGSRPRWRSAQKPRA